jgi:hypothetical protein
MYHFAVLVAHVATWAAWLTFTALVLAVSGAAFESAFPGLLARLGVTYLHTGRHEGTGHHYAGKARRWVGAGRHRAA